MTYQEIWTKGLKMLQNAGIDDAEGNVSRLFKRVYGIDAAHFIMHRDEEAPPEKQLEFRLLIERRTKHEPLQYILGNCGFMGWDFLVDPRVLIPRQDTETLVETFLDDVVRARPRETLKIADMCTGSGCVGISVQLGLRQRGYDSQMTLSDISVEALAVARKNAERLGVKPWLVISDMFRHLGRYHAILCNPPYIPHEECDRLMPEVSWHEPRAALDGGPDGLDFYRRIAAEAIDHLLPGPGLYLEIGYDQAKAVATILHDAGFTRISIVKDLAGHDRVIKARP